MCTFRLQIKICLCDDWGCKAMDPEIDERALLDGISGHIRWLESYYRDSGMCLDYFENNDPDRLVVRLGLDKDNSNSKMDCKNKSFVVGECSPDEGICEFCKLKCRQISPIV